MSIKVKNLVLETIRSHVETEMQMLDEVIKNELLGTEIQTICDVVKNLTLYKGKRLRPMLTILSCKLFSVESTKEYINVAAAIEMIHNATLLHDDVIDESRMRRGFKTANEAFGNKSSVLVGDFLLSVAFRNIVLTSSLEIARIISNASSIIVQGEIHQLECSVNIDNMNEDMYFKIIAEKTALLFAVAAEVGAVISNQSDEIRQKMYGFGLNIGMAFQIIDDLLDYFSTEEKIGKSRGDDFRDNKITLPLIALMKKLPESEKAEVMNFFINKTNFENVIDKMNKFDVYEDVMQVAIAYVDKARECLRNLGDAKIRKGLELILSFILERNF